MLGRRSSLRPPRASCGAASSSRPRQSSPNFAPAQGASRALHKVPRASSCLPEARRSLAQGPGTREDGREASSTKSREESSREVGEKVTNLKVSFAQDVDVEVPVMPCKQKARMMECGESPESLARKNMTRLLANHRRLTRRSCFLERWRGCLEGTVAYLSRRHVALAGDMMLVGRRPGRCDAALKLNGAQVDCVGRTVIVAPVGGQRIALQLLTATRAEAWAARVERAAELWENVHRAADDAVRRHGGSRLDAGLDGFPMQAGHCIEPLPESLCWAELSVFEEGSLLGLLCIDPVEIWQKSAAPAVGPA